MGFPVGLADEGEARAPGPALRPGAGGPRCGAGALRRQSAGVPDAERQADSHVDAAEDAPVPRSPPCRMASGRRSGIGRLRRRTTRAKSSRRRWPTWSRIGSRPLRAVGPCSSAGVGSWMIGRRTSLESAEPRTRRGADTISPRARARRPRRRVRTASTARPLTSSALVRTPTLPSRPAARLPARTGTG